MQDAVIFDMDGTLCNVHAIRHLVMPNHPDNKTGKKDFKAFHEHSINCDPNLHVVEAARRAFASGLAVLVLTARREEHRSVTKWWLKNNEVPYTQLLHRKNDDRRADTLVKKDMLDGLRQHYTILEAWDDNPRIIDLWKLEGIPQVHVVPGWHSAPKEVQTA